MISRLTVRLLLILSVITILVMTAFVMVRFDAASSLMQSNLEERSHAVAERVANSVRPTIWNIYKKAYDRSYTVELASAILDSEMSSSFVEGIKVFGNFGHLYMGRIKINDKIVSFDKVLHSRIWIDSPNRLKLPIKAGEVSIGNVEISFSDKVFTDNLYRNLIVEITQVAIVSLMFVGSLYLLLRFALVTPMQSLQVAEQALDAINEAVFVVDKYGRVLDVNPAYSKITYYSENELIGSTPAIHSSNDTSIDFTMLISNSFISKGNWSGEVIGQKKDGTEFPGWLSLNRVDRKSKTIKYVGVLTDIAEKKAAEDKLHTLAYFDSLTDVPNRHAFLVRFDQQLELARRDKHRVGLLYLDLDNFKWANDQYGHAVGDQLLISVAGQFKERLRESDMLYRIGGDEFTVVISDYKNEDQLVRLAMDLIKQASKEYLIEGKSINLGASVGISTFPKDSDNAKDLIIQADTAMYQAKEAGRGQVHFFSSELDMQRQEQQSIEQQLKVAIAENRLQLYYQPKVICSQSKMTCNSAEALVRWIENDRVLFAPDQFIAIAEQTNLICELGYWVIHTACEQLSTWDKSGFDNLKIAINLSPRQLRDEKLYDYLLEQMTLFDIGPEMLELEITEHAVIENIEESLQTLEKLKTLGVSIAMDDFGTGYSSLSYLKQLPIDVLKIDRSFIQTIPSHQGDIAIVTAIFSIAKALNLAVVAEGVENLQQLDFLTLHNCDMVQGYYFASALSNEDFIDWLENNCTDRCTIST
ncbi:EAL domain-containing protein [Neptunomonas sp.]|uniref:putative bifunctional diguanylate cyclase/phosphodiesterase n=1 Tax=Neptunomonas sp. TaxID=1971898 RepID=UPI0025F44CEC|nr:EAL domain-containing protein [Neptunomonas sp.]